jgi:hypothetical protein
MGSRGSGWSVTRRAEKGGATRCVGEGAPADDQDPATGSSRSAEGGQYGEAPGHGPARSEKEVGPAQLNSVVSDLNRFFN